MDAWVWIAIVLVAVVVIGVIAWYVARERKTRDLRETFGPEYERTMEDAPTRREAEAELAGRQKRREALEITCVPGRRRRRGSSTIRRGPSARPTS
jgi:flagellar biosynthesis/type III secretory pathway M-ring protein FliF/YscJ